ncbi:MAG TPA: hypothetical protein VE954_18930 [Oligoflexus sp.]|uniref:hypothetical protein n=1 Tax=Oligoflexus sp. TaxID=1971216 RepID=UPI002D44011F|nr:hypothetical protein [Oligoflexus sp.]HYX35175.1 hypothetical protein [Oligoflexus sp.]
MTENRELGLEVDRLRDERSRIAGELDINNEKANQLDAYIEDLNVAGSQAQNAYQTQLEAQTQALAETEADLAKLKVELDNAPTPEEQSLTQQKIIDLETRSKKQDADVVSLKQLLEASRTGEAAVAKRLAEEIRKARDVYDEQVGKLEGMEAANAKLTAALATRQDANRKLQDKAAQLEVKNSELRKQLGAASSRIKQLDTALTNLKNRYTELKSIHAKTTEDLSKTKMDLGAARASAAALQAELNALRLKNKQLETKNKELEAEVQKARAEAVQARAEAEKAKADAAAAATSATKSSDGIN